MSELSPPLPSAATDDVAAAKRRPPALAARGDPLAAGQKRMRLAIYGSFAVLALAMAAHGLFALNLESRRATDAAVLDQLGTVREQTQALARGAARLAADRSRHAAMLVQAIDEAERTAPALEPLLQSQLMRAGVESRALAEAMRDWQRARTRLWHDARELLRRTRVDGAVEEQGGFDIGVAVAEAQVQHHAEPALAAVERLAVLMRQGAETRASQSRLALQWGTGGLLVLLGALAVAAVEPNARAAARHFRRLTRQSADVQRLALVAEHTAALVVVTDAADRIQWVNDAFTQCCGYSLAEARGARPTTLLAHPDCPAEATQRLERAMALGEGIRGEWLARSRDGRDLWLHCDLRPVNDPHDGTVTGWVSVSSDITARVQQQGKLQALWSALPAGVVVFGLDGAVVDANRAAERLLGMALPEMRIWNADADERMCVLHEDGTPYTQAEMPQTRTLASGRPVHNAVMGLRSASGRVRWFVVNTEPHLDAQQRLCGVIAFFIDVTASHELQQQLQQHARTDALTRLANRAVAVERIQRALDHADRHPGYGFAVLFMDFDRFKQINDTLGHGAGDALLRQVAERLQSALRPGDSVARLDGENHVAARIGGDEFVVVLDGVADEARIVPIATRLLDELAEPYLIGTTPVQSSFSIGVVVHRGGSPDAGDSEARAETLLRNADVAMYEAKRAGRGRWVLFDDSMHERVVRAMAIETDLRAALVRDELFVVYQPVVDLATRELVGVESLVRWRHPERGIVAPADFIGVAEECGLIDAVGRHVLRAACTQYVAWQRTLGAAAPRQLAVNLSRAQLQRAALVDDVREILQATAMPPVELVLEVTESLAAQDDRVQATLRELKTLGVQLALDDFGTGYSSLACLHLLPVDTVKVDRSFVRHAETVEYHRVLIEATIRVARALGMTTVAEGIETPGQAALMQRLDCDRGQGYLFARPLAPDDLQAWIEQRAAVAAEALAD